MHGAQFSVVSVQLSVLGRDGHEAGRLGSAVGGVGWVGFPADRGEGAGVG